MASRAFASGSDWSDYGYTENQTLAGNAWAWGSGTGGASGGASAHWGYSGGQVPVYTPGKDGASGSWSWNSFGSGSYWESKDGGTVNGRLGESGDETYSMSYNTTASNPFGTGWTLNDSGSAGSVAATSKGRHGVSPTGDVRR